MAEFLAMGGYGAYVWPAYGLTFFVLAGIAGAIWRRGRTLKSRLAHYAKAAESADLSAEKAD